MKVIHIDHILEIYDDFLFAIVHGRKKHEIRKESPQHMYAVGQTIQFNEIRRSDMVLTGVSDYYKISHIDRMDIAGVYSFAIMSIERVPISDR